MLRRNVENNPGNIVELSPRQLQNVRHPVNDLVHQPAKQLVAAAKTRPRPVTLRLKGAERRGISITNGHQRRRRQHKRNRRHFGKGRIRFLNDGRRHKNRCALGVQSRGQFDLLHFAARGQLHPDRRLHEGNFCRRWLQQVNPQRFPQMFRAQRGPGLSRWVNGQHDINRSRRTVCSQR